MAYYGDIPGDQSIEAIDEEADTFTRMVLATRALRHDPGCIEALLKLAAYLTNGNARFAHLSQIIKTGDCLWQSVAPAYGTQKGDVAIDPQRLLDPETEQQPRA